MFSGHEELLELISERTVEEKTNGVSHDTSGHVKKIMKRSSRMSFITRRGGGRPTTVDVET